MIERLDFSCFSWSILDLYSNMFCTISSILKIYTEKQFYWFWKQKVVPFMSFYNQHVLYHHLPFWNLTNQNVMCLAWFQPGTLWSQWKQCHYHSAPKTHLWGHIIILLMKNWKPIILKWTCSQRFFAYQSIKFLPKKSIYNILILDCCTLTTCSPFMRPQYGAITDYSIWYRILYTLSPSWAKWNLDIIKWRAPKKKTWSKKQHIIISWAMP